MYGSQTARDKLPLVDSSGKEVTVKAEDARLYERNINEGDKVCFDVNNKLEKVE